MAIQQWSDTIWLVQLAEEPSLSEDLLNLRAQLEQLDPGQTPPDIVIDFSELASVNSSNLSQLLRLRKALSDRDGRLRLSGLNDGIWAVFLTTGLDKVFEFSPDVPTALASLQVQE